MANPVGRPRTVSPQPDEMIQLGQDMIDWIVENNPLHVSAWYSIKMGICERDWKLMKILPEFCPYYEQALKLIGQKYLDKTSNVREGVSQRWLRSYFSDLREEEDETAENKAKLASLEGSGERSVNVNITNYSEKKIEVT